MRPVLTKEQANELIDKIPSIQEPVYEAKDQKNLADCYRASLQAHECEELVGMIKPFTRSTKSWRGTGRKLGKADLEYMKQAQALLHGSCRCAGHPL